MDSMEQNHDFQRFCEDLEALKGKNPLYKPSEGFVQRILRRVACFYESKTTHQTQNSKSAASVRPSHAKSLADGD